MFALRFDNPRSSGEWASITRSAKINDRWQLTWHGPDGPGVDLLADLDTVLDVALADGLVFVSAFGPDAVLGKSHVDAALVRFAAIAE